MIGQNGRDQIRNRGGTQHVSSDARAEAAGPGD